MAFFTRHRSYEASRGWRMVVARVLALVVALAVAAGPTAGLAEDIAYHGGAHREAGKTLTVSAGETSSPADVDPGSACHIHCGCHQVAELGGVPVTPSPGVRRLVYPRVAAVPVSVAPDRLARPPRA